MRYRYFLGSSGEKVGQLLQAVVDVVDVDLPNCVKISLLDVGRLGVREAARSLAQHSCRGTWDTFRSSEHAPSARYPVEVISPFFSLSSVGDLPYVMGFDED
jgi:hypothetical protein